MNRSKKQVREDRVRSVFSKKLDELLQTKGITRNKLKTLSGVNTDRYNSSKEGRVPSLTSAVAIADALNVSLDDLCGRTEYAQDIEKLNAGECLKLIMILLKQTGGNITSSGDLVFPDSNIKSILCDVVDYGDKYEAARSFEPDRYPASADEIRIRYLSRKQEELSKSKKPIDIELFNADTFHSFYGETFYRSDCEEDTLFGDFNEIDG